MKFKYRDVRYSQIVRAHDQAEAKRQLKTGVLVLVMPNERPKSLKFLCPCGCGEVVSVNLMPGNEKAWTLDYQPKRGISLWPSVWLTSGCQSHFILRQNKARLLFGKIPKMSSTELSSWWGKDE
jgi:Family of unknown function (DUF6527)